MAEHDRHLDERLRDVPVPAGVEVRATADTVFGDDAIDRMLTAVALPTGLADRLRQTVDARPAGLRDGRIDLERIATKVRPEQPPRRRGHAFRRWMASLARDGVAVAVALSVAWLMFAAGSEFSRRLGAPSPSVTTASRSDHADVAGPADDRPHTSAPAPAVAASEPMAVTEEAPPSARERRPLVAAPAAVAEAVPARAAVEPRLAVRGAAVGAPDVASVSGVSLERPRDSWRRVPRVKGFDLAFEMAHGEAPFIDPSISGLASDVPPLTVATDSFDRLLARRDRRWKGQSRDLRVEHVLAALPAPGTGRSTDGLRLDVLGVRSLRSVGGVPTLLVEVTATADGGAANRELVEATLVLDRSIGGDPLAWTWLCRGLAAVGARMTPRDRLTVVIAGPVPRLAIRRGSASEIAALATELAELPATDVADLDAAIRMAEQESGTNRDRLVIAAHEATAERGRDDVRAALGKWHAFLAAATGEDASGPDVPRFVLIEPVVAGGGGLAEPAFGRTAGDGTSIRRGLLRQVFATDTLVARRCRISLAFDPRQVAAYRLVGHRQSAMESLSSSRTAPLDLHVGETARVVYEVVPRGHPNPGAVSAELTWQTAAGSAPKQSRQGLSLDASVSGAGLPAPHGCELVLAVAVAETLADSAHADPRAAKEAVRFIDRWRQRGDVTPCGERLAEIAGRPVVDRRPPR
jgi:hypothetical protein